MAKVRGPLYSISASGVIADAMVYAQWKGIAWVREQFIPQNPKTALQVAQRLIFTQGVDRWHYISASQKAGWQTGIERKGYTMSGFNYFMSEYIKSMLLGETPSDDSPL